MRPEGIPDPRDENTPNRYDDEEEDKARARVTVGELMAQAPPDDTTYEHLETVQLPPRRLAELRQRRDELIPLVREALGYGRE